MIALMGRASAAVCHRNGRCRSDITAYGAGVRDLCSLLSVERGEGGRGGAGAGVGVQLIKAVIKRLLLALVLAMEDCGVSSEANAPHSPTRTVFTATRGTYSLPSETLGWFDSPELAVDAERSEIKGLCGTQEEKGRYSAPPGSAPHTFPL
ncbi:hypothetical protein SKAU_G00314200 [Synaphobranchus kaupii]|uniref:Uncharacterized protein n=1 Tax=Synaphobranchus kaupii TaxID=118154 RepID=A0A9Q1ES90_SYNKA|nr:hypothetical protein SKAU_G00314200 [Synaphobranchus kaupii]